jgi:PAS domain S-box-containing protein
MPTRPPSIAKKLLPWILVGGLLLAWIPLFPWLMATFGPLGRAYALGHLCLAAWFWGVRGALAVAVINHLLSVALHHRAGMEFQPAFLGLLIGVVLAVLLGSLVDLKRRLQTELVERRRAEEDLKTYQRGLEDRVSERTALLMREVEERRAAERALRREKERYQLLLETTSEGVLVADAASRRFLYANPAICRLLGYTDRELMALAVDHIHPAASLPQLLEDFAAMGRGERNLFAEAPCLRKDGSLIYVDIQSTPVLLDGRPCLMGLFRDVTARRQAHQELEAERERFRLLVEEAPLGVSIIDEAGGYRYVNPKFTDMFGYALADLSSGRQWFDLAFPDPEQRRQAVQAWRQDRREQGAGTARRRIFDVACRDGSLKRVHFLPVTTSGGDDFVIYQDLTEQTRAARDLEQTHRLLGYVMENMAQAMVVCDAELRVSAYNRAFREMFDLGEENLRLGMKFADLVAYWAERYHPDPQMRSQALRNLVITKPFMVEMPMSRDEGQTGLVQMFHNPLPEGGFVRTFTDVTERLRAEVQRASLEAQLRQSQKLEAIGTLASGVAHDFNNILSIVCLSAEAALQESPPLAAAGEKLERVLNACRRGKGLVNQILTFSRQRERKPELLEVGALVKETMHLMEAALPANIAVSLVLPPRPLRMLADPTELHQVLVNLCTNAAHAMREGGGTLSVELGSLGQARRQGLPPGPYLALSVSDSGRGMDQATLERIFEPYFTTKPSGEGTGLGLAMVHGIVEGLGGRVTVQSRPGLGSTFRVALPALASDPEAGQARAEDSPRGQGRILYVEDEEEIRFLGREIITGLGYQVVTAADGEKALELFSAAPEAFDLVVTDLAMPGLDGYELIARLQALRPELPMVLCSGYLERGQEDQMRQNGVKEVLDKPFSRAELARALDRALDRALA